MPAPLKFLLHRSKCIAFKSHQEKKEKGEKNLSLSMAYKFPHTLSTLLVCNCMFWKSIEPWFSLVSSNFLVLFIIMILIWQIQYRYAVNIFMLLLALFENQLFEVQWISEVCLKIDKSLSSKENVVEIEIIPNVSRLTAQCRESLTSSDVKVPKEA